MINGKIIAKYTVILFLATFVVGFAFGLLKGFLVSAGKAIPTWIIYWQAITGIIASVVVFARLTVVQKTDTVLTVFAVGLISWVVSFFPNVLLFGQNVFAWAFGLIILLVIMIIGIGVGILFKRKPSTALNQ